MFKDRPDLYARAMKRQLEKIEAGIVECTCQETRPTTIRAGHSPDCPFETAWTETVEEIRAEDLEPEIDAAIDRIGESPPPPCPICNGLRTIPNPNDHELNVRAPCPLCDVAEEIPKITFAVRSNYPGGSSDG